MLEAIQGGYAAPSISGYRRPVENNGNNRAGDSPDRVDLSDAGRLAADFFSQMETSA